MTFQLNERLAAGSHHLATIDGCQIRLKDNALFPWFLIVPEVASDIEDLHQLDAELYRKVTTLIYRVSEWVEQTFAPTKLNVGCIGNQVRQMHIHIVARCEHDPAWPGTVWAVSKSAKKPYTADRIDEIHASFAQAFAG